MENNIPVFKPSLTEMEEGWLGPGKYVGEFEQKIANHIDVEPENVVAVNTGTSAVHLGLIACDVTEGDEVVTPSFNNIADFQMIRAQSAEPVFADVDENSLTLDPASLEKLITKKTKSSKKAKKNLPSYTIFRINFFGVIIY